MTLYCQSCDYSFEDRPANAFPQYCPQCGGCWWANWRRGEMPLALRSPQIIGLVQQDADAPMQLVTFVPNAADPVHWSGALTLGAASGPGCVTIFPPAGTP